MKLNAQYAAAENAKEVAAAELFKKLSAAVAAFHTWEKAKSKRDALRKRVEKVLNKGHR